MEEYFIRWWKSPFASITITVSGTNIDDIKKFAWFEAKQKGWKPRKWYEWYRWFDIGIPPAERG